MLVFEQSRRDSLHHFHPINNSFANMEYDWNNSQDVYNHINSQPMYPREPEYDFQMKPQMTRSTSSNSGFVAPGLMPSSDSTRSASSSTVGSPYSGHLRAVSQPDTFPTNAYAMHGLGVTPAIVNQDGFQHEYPQLAETDLLGSFSFADLDKIPGSFVDPTLINSASYSDPSMFDMPNSFGNPSPMASPAVTPNHMAYNTQFSQPASPAPSHQWAYAAPFQHAMHAGNFIQQSYEMARRPSIHSFASGASHASPVSDMNEEGEKGRCPFAECGKSFKDLKAHMLTHQAERPEKCPIMSCEYHLKGFARKYDKNRHTLTHYKGTMVCGFCPDTGTSAEKTFNRADVFKRHLTSVHQVEQTPPNSRKRSPTGATKKSDSYRPDAAGKCSTCLAVFQNAQDFYEHLDDCVLRMVQQVEPSEDINAQHLAAISNDKDVQETFDRHMIKMEEGPTTFDEEDDEDDEDDDEDEDASYNGRSGKAGVKSNKSRVVLAGAITKKSQRKGVTWSQGGVALAGKGRKKRKDYPPAWGMHADKMRMKKRVTCVYDGQRRLAKDELMLNSEYEVRMPLPGGSGYVTDLDVETIKRAEGFLNATEAEKGPWAYGEADPQDFDLQELMA